MYRIRSDVLIIEGEALVEKEQHCLESDQQNIFLEASSAQKLICRVQPLMLNVLWIFSFGVLWRVRLNALSSLLTKFPLYFANFVPDSNVLGSFH